jgi:pimeloyl-ACP methyl ester carboxylesterase
MPRCVTVAVGLSLILGALACSPRSSASSSKNGNLSSCRVAGINRVAECGEVSVDEDRAKPGTKIGLRVVLLRANGSAQAPDPLFLLAGGPGQAASEAFGPILPYMSRLNMARDIVLVDQRGTGQSAPFGCPVTDDLVEQMRVDALERSVERCVPKLSRDTSLYTTEAAADDLDDVRRALGYEQINLLGMSYGTRLAMVYARRHPDRLRSMVLDGVAPPWMKIPASFAADAQRALDLLLARCAVGPCGKHFPTTAADLSALLDELEEHPREITVPHPRTGEPLRMELTRAVLAQGVRTLLYSPELSALLPYTIARAKAGDFATFVAQTAMFVDASYDKMSLGLMLSVVCREDVERIQPADITGSNESFLSDAVVTEFRSACVRWPHGTADAALFERVKLQVPTMVLSGELDPVTPRRWGDDVLEDLPNGRHFVVPGMSHGVTVRSCMPGLVRRFIEAPAQLTSIDASCVSDDAPPFFIDAAGPGH